MAARPYWKGQIRLSLVSLPVEIYAATNNARQVPMHELYKKTGERVHHQLVVGEKKISREDIVKGYEFKKGQYVTLEQEEIKELKLPSKDTLDIVQFVGADEIDEVYYEKPYFVVPADKGAEDAFRTIREGLKESGKCGLGQLIIGGRERLCTLKPHGSGMLLETLRYSDEVKQADAYFDEIRAEKIDKEQLQLAKQLIKQKTSKFNAKIFHDHYREALRELIEAKVEKRKPDIVMENKPQAKVINLMDALRKSLKGEAQAKPQKKDAKPAKSKAKKTTAKRKAG